MGMRGLSEARNLTAEGHGRYLHWTTVYPEKLQAV